MFPLCRIHVARCMLRWPPQAASGMNYDCVPAMDRLRCAVMQVSGACADWGWPNDCSSSAQTEVTAPQACPDLCRNVSLSLSRCHSHPPSSHGSVAMIMNTNLSSDCVQLCLSVLLKIAEALCQSSKGTLFLFQKTALCRCTRVTCFLSSRSPNFHVVLSHCETMLWMFIIFRLYLHSYNNGSGFRRSLVADICFYMRWPKGLVSRIHKRLIFLPLLPLSAVWLNLRPAQQSIYQYSFIVLELKPVWTQNSALFKKTRGVVCTSVPAGIFLYSPSFIYGTLFFMYSDGLLEPFLLCVMLSAGLLCSAATNKWHTRKYLMAGVLCLMCVMTGQSVSDLPSPFLCLMLKQR